MAVFHHTFPAMHTRFSLVLPDVEASAGRALANEVEVLVQRQERLMSRFDPHSPVSEINERAANAAVAAPAPFWDVLQTCQEHWQRTGGAFDIAHLGGGDFQDVHLDTTNRTVRFAAPGLQLDLGGIGKGLALEKMDRALRRRGVSRAFLSFGESSITVIGAHPAGAHWPVGIADLFQPDRTLHCFALRDASVSTSGDRADSGHIVNPSNGHRVTGPRTLSVACASAVDAEVLSTALLAVPLEKRAEVLKNYPETEAVEIVYDTGYGAQIGRVNWHHES